MMDKTYYSNDAVIFDIDGTLSNFDHRRHFVNGKKKDFEKFYSVMENDDANEQIISMCNMFYLNSWNVIICTGRPDKYRAITEKWLKENDIAYHTLMMRPEDEKYKPDFILKEEMLSEITKTKKVKICFDDRDRVVKMWRENGITCCQVAEGNF